MSTPPATSTGSISLAFASDSGASFECRLDAGGWTPCASPTAYSALPAGEHAFSVRAVSAHGIPDPIPAVHGFSVVPPPPLPTPTPAVLWSGDFETGDLSQWRTKQFVPGGAEIVTAPQRQGVYSARFQVRPGDDPISAYGERAEISAPATEAGSTEGNEAWYGWATYFPADLNPTVGTSATNIFTQWHQEGAPPAGTTIPPIRFSVDTGPKDPVPFHMFLRVSGGRVAPFTFRKYDLGQIPVDEWVDFVFHVSWSSDATTGFVELWVNGLKVVPRTSIPTMYAGKRNYLKQGWYRSDSAVTSLIYHDAMRRGTSYAAVDSAIP